MSRKTIFLSIFAISVALTLPFVTFAEDYEQGESITSHAALFAETFFWIAIVLIAAKLSSLVEKMGQPPILGMLVMGLILGNLTLLDINFFEPIKSNELISFLAELGVVILLFQIGLKLNIQDMAKVGWRAYMVATVGIVTSFVLGTYFVGPWLLPDQSANVYLFLGAALTATSVGISARVFRNLNKLQLPEARIIIGAAVIDNFTSLVILAVISAIATLGAVSLGGVVGIIAKVLAFLLGAITVGQFFAPILGRVFSKIHAGVGMKFTVALSFGLIFAYIAQRIGIAPIVGAFAAGLVLDPVHFRYFKEPQVVEDIKVHLSNVPAEKQQEVRKIMENHAHRHVEDLIEPLGIFLVPIFFVVTGMNVDIDIFFNLAIILAALGFTAVAFIGKYVSGFVAGPVNKNIVGFGMVARGEIGLIFATIGRALGVLNDEIFSIIVITVVLSMLLTPPILSVLLKKQQA